MESNKYPGFLKPLTDSKHEARKLALASLLSEHPRTSLEFESARRLVELCYEEGSELGVPPLRLLAIMLVESAGNHQAVSPKGAQGLLQLMPGTAAFIARQLDENLPKRQDLFNRRQNIRYGAWYYQYLLEMYGGDDKVALAAYNWGPGRIDSRLQKGARVPRKYVSSVLRTEQWFKERWSEQTELHLRRRQLGSELPIGDARRSHLSRFTERHSPSTELVREGTRSREERFVSATCGSVRP